MRSSQALRSCVSCVKYRTWHKEQDMEFTALVALTALLGALVLLVALAVGRRKEELREEAEQETETAEQINAVKGTGPKKQKQEKQRNRKDKPTQHSFNHRLLAASLKSHSGNVTCIDFSSNGKYLASCADDRTVRIWSTKDFLEREHKCLRANVDLDHATLVRFSPDSRAFITWLANGDTIRVFKMIKKDDGTYNFKAAAEDFPQKHKAPILNIGIAETGKFIMSASTDTTIYIWDLKGEVLASINTNQMTNSYAAVSPCGRFVASCGFTPDVKVWEVCFGKGGEFKEVARAFDLKGHSAGVHAFAFSNDSRRMVTVSKDGTWKLWNTDVEYKKQQDPYLLKTVPCSSSDGSLVALSPDGRVVAVSDGCNVAMYDATSGRLEEELHSVHNQEITELRFDINGRFLVSSGDKAIRVFHNAPGYRAAIRDMQDMLKKAQNEAMKQRLQQQIKESQNTLDSVLAASSE
ncbi:transducin beta-like protein 2 [Gouania willdenowi]|uniref:Transducin beta-like protein 2 n=1 Tax=Gouania willdenowi TaxID=441366 RepID=A0A8C5EP63_GOUWI|nr:transducin beta-like protein 2 [Gouania willdenowi]